MKIFYINLDRRSDRNERFMRYNAHIADFVRCSAVEGNNLILPDLVERKLIEPGFDSYGPGALGCMLSHKSLWDEAQRSGKALTIAEDDAVFHKAFVDKSKTLLRSLPKNWDIVLWGWNFDSILHVQMLDGVTESVSQFTPTLPDQALSDFQNKQFAPLPLKLLGAFGMVCYTISARGAARLNQICFPLRKEIIPIRGLNRNLINFSIDVVLNKWYPQINAYACFPPLVLTPNDKSQSDNFPSAKTA
ncbi:MAG: glycosyltransferase family 25 protein [Gammaproteobacteria bacterium]